MKRRRGSAVIYVVLAILVFGTVMSYIFTRTANSEINQLSHINEIKKVYDNTSASAEIYNSFISQVQASDGE